MERARIKKLFEKTRDRVDCVLIPALEKTNPDLQYYCGAVDREGCALILTQDSATMVDKMLLKKDYLVPKTVVPKESSLDELAKQLKEYGKIGIGSDMSIGFFKTLRKKTGKKKWVNVSRELSQNRLVKENREIDAIRKTSRLADGAMSLAFELLGDGLSENLVKAKVLEYLFEREAFSEDLLVAAGRNGYWIHNRATSKRIKKTEPVVLDIFPKHGGYFSDETRTVCLKPDKKTREKYEWVKEAHDSAVEETRIGVGVQKPWRKAVEVFEKHSVAKNFKHSLGHGVGLQIHEQPNLGEKGVGVFEKNMVFTIEPGLYFEWGGFRLENTFVLKKNGPQALTKSKTSLTL